MKKKLKKAWIKALRSGEYKQAQESLRVGDAFCCLGVLCDISGKGKWTQTDKNAPFQYQTIDKNGFETLDYGYAPNKLFGGDPYDFTPDNIQEQLVEMNDEGKSFKKIAKWIEENV